MSQATALLADAESSISSGAWDQAIQQLESIKQSEPHEPDVYRKLAYVQAIRGKFRSVIATYIELIGVLVESDQLADAESVIGKVLSLQPESEEAREKRIQIEKKRGHTDRAVYLARELARLCIEQGDGDRSIRLLQEAQKEQPENLDISLELAEMFVSHGQIQDGANQYRRVANAFQEAGSIAKAAEAYRRMKVVQSDDPAVLLTLGRLYTELGKLDEAEQEFRSVLRHDLEHQDALMELGLVCQLKGRFRSGLLAFNKVLQNNPRLGRAMRKLGELNLSMGKQSEAVQHFLEAAQAYLEVEERDQAIEVFQMVLGVEEGNAQAQQGLTNLGAPLVAKEFVPPLPPVPPEDEAPTPEPSPVSALESIPEPPSSSASHATSQEKSSATPKASSSPGAGTKSPSSGTSKGPRKGLVSGGLLRKGLVDPSGGGKPMLGGKPTLGGGGSSRAGLRRPGLGMKDGGHEKPMLGMGGGGASKPTLGRRSAPEPSPPSEQVFEAEEEMDFSFGVQSEEPMESMFDSEPESPDTGLENDFESSANGLFENEMESPFGEGLGDSLFAPDETGDSPKPSAPVLGAFSHQDAGDSGGGSGDFLPTFSKSASAEEAEGSDDDLFDFGGAESLFDEPDSSSSGLFDDESLPVTQLFDEDAKSTADLFDDAGVAESRSVAPESSGNDLFSDEQFDNLFDESDGVDPLASSDTIGSMKSSDSSSSLFEEAQDELPSATSSDDSGFGSLFSEVDDGSESLPLNDLFGEQVESSSEPAELPVAERNDGLYREADESTDLFGEDLFPDASELEKAAVSGSGEDDLFSGADLFSEPQAPEAESSVRGLFDDVQAPAQSGGGLFDEAPLGNEAGSGLFGEEEANDDLFGDDDLFSQTPVHESGETAGQAGHDVGLAAEEETFDLFTEPLPPEHPSGGLSESSSSAGGLFDGFEAANEEGEDALFGDVKSGSEGGLFDDEAASGDDLFGNDGDDLFGVVGVAEVKSEVSFQETSLDLGGEESGGLFGDDTTSDNTDTSEPEGDMFDIPDPRDSSALFDEVAEAEDSSQSLFDEDPGLDSPGGGLFDSLNEADAGKPEPLDLDLPMPNDPPFDFGSAEPEPMPMDGDLFSSAPPADSGNGMDEHSLTIDKLRAEEMARVVDVESVESSDSPEFMKLLEMTLPKAEDEVVEEESAEDFSPVQEPEMVSPQGEGGLFDEPLLTTDGGGLFEQEQEDIFDLEPVPADSVETEGPDILGKPKVSVSIEDEAPTTEIELTDQLDASLAGSDVAAKIGAYRKALEETPNNLVMRTRLADIHLKYGMLEDALVQYRQVMRRNTESISLLHRVIQAEFWTENYAEAGESLLVLAKLHLKRGEHHDALDTLQSVLSLDSHHFEARKVLVSVFTSMDESKLAAHHLRQLAETALTKGEVDEAISAFGQLLEISNDPVFEERLAQIYESQGEMELALRSFQSLVVRYQQEERWEEAARVTERIVELNPELLDDRGALVDLYKKLGMIEKAMEQQFKLARLYQQRDQLPVAIELYEGVLEGQAHNQEARRHLVDAYLDSGNVSLALEQAEALTEHYLNSKDHQTAVELYDKLVKADPENVELQERLVKFYGLAGDLENAKVRWIGLADLHQARGRFVNAAEAIQKALDLDESQIELQNRLALLYAEQLNDQAAALTQLRKLFQLAPERLDAVKMYIDILLRQQQVSEAGQVLQQLEQAGGESVAIKNDVISSLRNKVESNPADLKARFNYGELCYHLLDLDHAIEQFQQTRRNPEFELMSYNMLGLCFAKKKGFNMLDLAIKQFKKGLETKVQSEQSHLELRYNLAAIQYQNGRLRESLADFKECYRVDITYRDVRSWIEKIESELASSGS